MTKCTIDDCSKEARHNNLCTTHYKRWWRHGNPTKTMTPLRGQPKATCKADNCSNSSSSTIGYCSVHYQRWAKNGHLETSMAPKGVGGFDTNGYYLITVNGKRVYEHIHIAEKALGRPLPKGAVVHHMNEIKHDNETPFNLVICPDQAYHLLLHRRAKELGYK